MKRFNAIFLPSETSLLIDDTSTTGIILMDQSGSMRSIKDAAIQALGTFVGDLFEDKNAAKMFIGMFGFNSELTELAPIQSALSFNRPNPNQYIPNGSTWLYRRIGDALEMIFDAKADGRLRGNVTLNIFTDGRDMEEGDAGKHSLERLQQLVTQASQCDWMQINIHGISNGDLLLAEKIAEKIGLDPRFATTVRSEAIHATMHDAARRTSIVAASLIGKPLFGNNKPQRGLC